MIFKFFEMHQYVCVCVCVCVYIRGGTVHKCHGSETYLGSGVAVRYDFGTTGEKNLTLLCLVSFHLF